MFTFFSYSLVQKERLAYLTKGSKIAGNVGWVTGQNVLVLTFVVSSVG